MKKYSNIFERAKKLGISKKQVKELIKIYKEEYLNEPQTFGDLLEVFE